MKSLTLIVVILFIAVQSFGQTRSAAEQRLFYFNKVEKYRKMKNAGTILTIAGGVLSVAGIVTLANSSIITTDDGYGNTTTSKEGHPIAGLLMFVGGDACMGAGIPLWIIGSKKKKKYDSELETLTVKLDINQKTSGFKLAYRF